MRYFWIQEQVRDEDFSIKKEKNRANVGTKPIFASVLQCCSNCKIGILLNMDPTLHYKMKADEAYDGSGKWLQPQYVHTEASVCTQRPSVCTQRSDADSETLAQKQKTGTDSCQC